MAKEVVEDRASALRSLLMIAIVIASIGIIVGAVKPSEVLKRGGRIVAAVIAAIVIFNGCRLRCGSFSGRFGVLTSSALAASAERPFRCSGTNTSMPWVLNPRLRLMGQRP